MNKRLIWQGIRLLIILVVVVLFHFIFKYTISWFYPFLIAFIIAKIIHPLISFLEIKSKFPRGLATLVVLIGLVTVVFTTFFLLVSEIIDGTLYLADKLPIYFDTLIIFFEQIINDYFVPFYQIIMSWIQSLDNYQQVTIQEHIKQLTDYLSTAGTTFLQGFLLMIPTMILALPHSLMIFIIILIATYFMAKDWTNLKKSLSRIIPLPVVHSSKKVLYHLERSVFGFLKAQIIIVSISTGLIFLGLCILNVKHALTIALLMGLVDIMPLIGTGLIFIPWLVYLFITHNYGFTIGLSVIYMIVVITRQIVEPKVLSSNIGINPLLALIILFFCIQFWGISGILLSPILLIIISALFQSGIIKQVTLFVKGQD